MKRLEREKHSGFCVKKKVFFLLNLGVLNLPLGKQAALASCRCAAHWLKYKKSAQNQPKNYLA
jgi:hypothetical protein